MKLWSWVSGLVLLALVGIALPLAAEVLEGSQYACQPLSTALRDLQGRGLNVVFSSNLVRDDLLVTRVPTAGSLRQVLGQLLEPHGLRAQDGVGGRVLVVQDFESVNGPGVPRSSQPWETPSASTGPPAANERDGVLPAWVDRETRSWVATVEVPEVEPSDGDLSVIAKLDPTTRYLILQLSHSSRSPTWDQFAYRLKAMIVDARAASRELRVGLEASAEAVDELLDHGLAPYLDAYVFERAPRLPAGDPTARLWWRPAPDGRRILPVLLAGAAAGAELVLLENEELDRDHRAFLQQIQATPSVDLEVQPAVDGVDPERVRILYNLETGSYYLALYAERGSRQRLALTLDEGLMTRSLFPEEAVFSQFQLARKTELEIPGEHPYYLLELRRETDKVSDGTLRVNGAVYIDPYELVVKNQIFQEREAQKVRSLAVMERRHSVSQTRSARQYTWHHRIIERRDHLTEFHHLGIERNGVPIPERKLRVGRDFRTEAQVELGPLEIELDRTYRYELLGEQEIDGQATWKIGFEPLQKGSFLSGVVWVDQRTSAHRRLQAVHTGLAGPLISREVTRHYDWIADDNQCFWNWSRSEGLSVVEALHSQVAYNVETERYEFDYNPRDIGDVVRQAHTSDVPIHVAAPPDGHRWLVKQEPARRGRLKRLFGRSGRSTASAEEPRLGARSGLNAQTVAANRRSITGARVLGGRRSSDALVSGEDHFDGRVLADRNVRTSVWDIYALSQQNCTNTITCGGLGLDYYRSDLFRRGAEFRGGLLGGQGYASLTVPRVFGADWVLTTSLFHDVASWENSISGRGADRLLFRERRSHLRLSLARPLSKRIRIRGTYGLQQIELRSMQAAPTPGFVLPTPVEEQIGRLQLDIQQREAYARISLQAQWREAPGRWGIDSSEDLTRSPGGFSVIGGYSTRLRGEGSLGLRGILQKSWHLDHFSDNFSGFDGVRAPGFQPMRYDRGLGASATVSHNLWRRIPISWRLEGAILRHDRYGDADQLGVEAEVSLDAWFKTDLFMRLGYGLYSSRDDEAGDFRSRIIVARRF